MARGPSVSSAWSTTRPRTDLPAVAARRASTNAPGRAPRARTIASALVVTAVTTSCLPALSIPEGALLSCTMGAHCPRPMACLESASLCVAPDAPCVQLDHELRLATADDDGAACTTAAGEAGVCRAGRCGAVCGDGILDAAAGELCDLGAANDDVLPDHCRTDCAPARCGDGVVDTGESCDHDGADCAACLLVCGLDTVDLDGAAGCEEPLVVRPAIPGITSLSRSPAGLVFTNVDDEIRALTLDGTGDTLLYRHTSFISDLQVAPSGRLAFRGGTAAEVYLLADGVATFVVDGVDAFALADDALFVSRTDGFDVFIARIDVATLAEERLDNDPAFPETFALTPTRAVWVRAPDQLVACPRSGGAADVTVMASGVLHAQTLAADGEDVWAYDELGDLWVVDAAGAREVKERPGVVAGGSAFDALQVDDGQWYAGWTVPGSSLDDTDDVGALLAGDAAGAFGMRARMRGYIGGLVAHDDAILVVLSGQGIVRVPR